MSTAEIAIHAPSARRRTLSPIAILARRRFQLTVRTPRELLVPLLTPIMFALVMPRLSRRLCTRTPTTSRSSRSEPSAC